MINDGWWTDSRGDKYHFWNGVLHCDTGPAIIRANGSQEWIREDKRHRDSGPAYIGANGTQGWYKNGLLHRLDGFAWIGYDGRQEFWVEGTEFTEKEFNEKYGVHKNKTDFKSQLQSLINLHLLENGSDTPDFILAKYLSRCLENWDLTTLERDKWYGIPRGCPKFITTPNSKSIFIESK